MTDAEMAAATMRRSDPLRRSMTRLDAPGRYRLPRYGRRRLRWSWASRNQAKANRDLRPWFVWLRSQPMPRVKGARP